MILVPTGSGPRSQRTAQRHRALHDRLLAAAEHAIEADGLANLRARGLAEAVGCSVGALYSVFPDLDAVIMAVNGRTLEAIDAVMRAAGGATDPADHLAMLADAYLDYAATHRQRWGALFQFRSAEGDAPSPGFVERQAAAFAHIEAPLAVLQPDLPEADRVLLARTLFSAVQGMVALGLDEKLVAVPLPVLRAQVRLVVRAMAKGLA